MMGTAADYRMKCEACGSSTRRRLAGLCTSCLSGGLSWVDEEEKISGFGDLEVRIPGHEIEGKIGDTGFSQIFRGWQLEPRREVAIKILCRSGREDDGLLERFRQEIKIGASLGNQGCVQVFESGFSNDAGIFYFTMEFMGGGTICDYARDRVLDLESRVRLFLPLCATMTAAHQIPVLHRDLKPGNVLVTTDGEVKLGDFGLAKMLAKEEDGITLKATSTQFGTPVYMSPEQARAEAATTLSDVYGLGAVLYELLTGERPFSEEGGPYAIMRRVDEVPMREPVGIPADLKAIVGKAMAKIPSERYQSALALGNDLRAFLNGQPVMARRGQFLYVVKRRLRKHWLGLGIAAGAAAFVMVGVGYHLREIEEKNRVAKAAYLEARSLLATMVTDTAKRLTEAGREDAAEEIALRALEFNWDLPIEAADGESNEAPEYLRMEVFALNGEVQLKHRRPEKAAQFFQLALGELEDWKAPPGMEFWRRLRKVEFRFNLLKWEGSRGKGGVCEELLNLENSLQQAQAGAREYEEAIILRAQILRWLSQNLSESDPSENGIKEEFAAALSTLEMELDARLEKKREAQDLESYRCVLADARRDFLGRLGGENRAEAEDAVERWTSLYERNRSHVRIGRARIMSVAQLALLQAQAGSLDEAVASFEGSVGIWKYMNANQIVGFGTLTEEGMIELGVQIMAICNPTRPELTLRVVEGCIPVFDFAMPRVHRERAVEGFIPPELWPIYAEGRKYEARARWALGDLDEAWGAFSGCSGRLGELCRMTPSDPEVLLQRCELLAEWAMMPAPPREPSHPARVVDFLHGIVTKVGSMPLDSQQRRRLEDVKKVKKVKKEISVE